MKSIRWIAMGIVTAGALFVSCASSEKKEAAMSADHPKFETLCSKCHTLDRVETAHTQMKQEEMKAIVKRMAEKPNSGIDMNNINDIVREIY
jgi:hypothetical protein